ncbi:GDP-L-fucose synthase [Hymenobacter glaciei]|uniref:GDP-L-fucose synthase n=1 Tax=Hymenobacter glaciei TaxID=877209 RepID=A0ABP7TPL5_9BACT
MQVALLGHTGFLGKNVADALTQAGIAFAGASRGNGVDLRSVEQTADFLRNTCPDVVLHCAAHVGSFNYVTENASAVMLDNSRMALSVYEAMAQVCPQAIIVHPLANCVFPANAETMSEETWQDGPVHSTVLPFAATRRLAWAAGESFAQSHGIRSISLLVPNMYGPHDSTDPNQTAALDALISRFLTARRTGQPVVIWGSGAAIREWIFAPDLARIMVEICLNPQNSGLQHPLNVAQNTGLSIRELAGMIQRIVGYDGAVHYDLAKPDGVLKKVMDDTRFRQVFPDFKFTDFEQGIATTVAYYKELL